MKYIRPIARIVFLFATILWTIGAATAFSDRQVTDISTKLFYFAMATTCWGVVATFERIWK